MEKFTKGEWIAFCPHEVLKEGLMSVEADDGKLICKAEVYKSTISEVTANAHLIAAAPEMYEMLAFVSDESRCNVNYVTAEKIRDLLAKARGEL